MNLPFPAAACHRYGFALIAVLAMVVVVSLAAIVFISRSQLGAAASNGFSNAAKASLLAQDAINTVAGSLQEEVMDPFYSSAVTSGTTTLYFPFLAANVLPQLDPDALTLSTDGIPNVLKSSRANSSASSNRNYLASFDSNVTTDTPSANGRSIPASRWNDPKLLTKLQNTASFDSSSGATCPYWIYVNRNGPVALKSFTPSLSQPTNGGATNYSYVVGRYAYRVYDLSGLLDMNVAGYPAAAADGAETGRKGTLAWLDFSTSGAGLGLNSASTALFDWRGPSASYRNYADDFGRLYGFMIAPPASFSDPVTATTATFPQANRFLTRDDLVRFAYDETAQFVAASDVTVSGADPAPEPFLSQATMFSREVNAPSWGPDPTTAAGLDATTFMASPTNLNPVSSVDGKTSASVADTRVTVAFKRRDGTATVVGEPLLKTRFPLEKIDLFNNPADNATQIQSYFGLVAQGDGTWKYVNTDNSTRTVLDPALKSKQTAPATGERLHTLQEVAALGREPDFFELLQAGIQPDSLGQGVADVNGTFSAYFCTAAKDQNLARHILQIGANIIDQWTSGSDPTVIRRTPLTSLTAAAPDPDICGIKNLPYIELINRTFFRRFDISEVGPSGSTNYPHVTSFYQFQLWNPHQNASTAAGNFRIVAEGTVQIHLVNIDNAGGGAAKDVLGQAVTYTSQGTKPDCINFTPASDPNLFAEPAMLMASSKGVTSYSSTNGDSTTNIYTHNKAQILGFWQGDLVADYDGFTNHAAKVSSLTAKSYYERFGTLTQSAGTPLAGTPADGFYKTAFASTVFTAINPTSATGLSVLSFQLQKLDANGNWRPIQTIPAIQTSRYFTSDSITLYNKAASPAKDDSDYIDANPLVADAVILFPDPRTTRFGGFSISSGPIIGTTKNGTTAPAFAATKNFVFMGWLPGNQGANANAGATLDLAAFQLYANTPGSVAYYTDRGRAITRQGDIPGTSPYTTGSTARPIMLNRRFDSLAELGYAFRDLPWKSLNFSQDDASATAAAPKPTADAGLLDLFSLTASPLRAGVVNLNAASLPVLTSLLTGTALAPGSPTLKNDPTVISSSDAASLAQDIQNYLGTTKGRGSPTRTVGTAADIAQAIQASSTAAGWSKFKKEAAVAALADVHNARTWNLLIDAVAQTGRFPAQNTNAALGDFVVTGQKHLLYQVAIDRYTGKIVDRLLEPSLDSDAP